MNKLEYNTKALNDIYKNAHIALQSIADLLGDLPNHDIKTELQNQYEGYDNFINKVSSYMAENDIEPKDISPLKKAMLWGSIKMKTLMNNSQNQIAEMMINGTVMGITELSAMKNESQNLDEGVYKLLAELLALEEEYEERLKKFL
jgi:hypothetical protein